MAAELNFMSPQEYLALERKAEYKSEYVTGVIYAMAGASESHNIIVMNLGGRLNLQLEIKPCKVYPSDMKVSAPSTLKYFYPDLSVVCDKPVFADDKRDVLLNPLLLVEVLSETTSGYDRGKKFQYYQEIESFQEYLLVAQDEPVVERFVKQSDGSWVYVKVSGLDQSIDLMTIDCRLSLQEIYAKVF